MKDLYLQSVQEHGLGHSGNLISVSQTASALLIPCFPFKVPTAGDEGIDWEAATGASRTLASRE